MAAFYEQWGHVIWKSLGETLQMTSISLLLSVLIGIPLGLLIVLTRPGQLFENKVLYQVLNLVINVVRSIPFIILLFLILPFTKFIVGTTIGVQGVIVPLVVYTAPYLARLMETALLEVSPGVVEAYTAMGIKRRQIVFNVLLREARSAIVLGLTIATVGLVGATAMAGLVGAGGLGDLAYRFGHIRYQVDVMYAAVFILILLVQVIQSIGNRVASNLKRD